jgi:hypothetical protein
MLIPNARRQSAVLPAPEVLDRWWKFGNPAVLLEGGDQKC